MQLRVRMAHVVASSSLSVGSEQLNAYFSSPFPRYYCPNTTTSIHKSFFSLGLGPHGHGYTMLKVKATKAKTTKEWKKHCMFVHPKQTTSINDGVLHLNGKDVLVRVPDNVTVSPWTEDNSSSSAFFVGAKSIHESSRHVFKLGVIQDMRLLCLFRFKIWWMIPRVGNSESDSPVETQMLMLEVKEPKEEKTNGGGKAAVSYIVLLPVLDGDFRSSLQGNSANEVELCVESGNIDALTLLRSLCF